MSWSTTVATLFVCCVAASQWSFTTAIDETNQLQQQHDNHLQQDWENRALRGVPLRASSQFSSSDRHSAVDTTPSSQIEYNNIAGDAMERDNYNLNSISRESSGFQPREPQQGEITVCRQMTLDFAKASNGRVMWGGEFVGGEWFHTFGLTIDAQGHDGKKNLHPMIFDSTQAETNGLGSNDAFALGSPNKDCEGFGVGVGGKIGTTGENCKSLGNLLIPSQKPELSSTTKSGFHPPRMGGVLIFEFHRDTTVQSIGLLNVGSSDQVMIIPDDGNLDKVDLESVGQNGFQKINLDMDNVKKLYVSLHSFGAVTGLDLCIAPN